VTDKYKHLAPKRKPHRFDFKKYKMCMGKKMYPTKNAALENAYGEVKRAYRCPHCKNYHLTRKKRDE